MRNVGYAFISYSTKNQSSADSMRELFTKHDIDTWMAPYDIPVGSKYAAVITKAIRDCDCFVLLLSNDSQESVAVDSEVELATLTYRKSIIVVELEKVILNDAFTFYIHNKQIMAVRKIEENTAEIRKILHAVKTYTNSKNDDTFSSVVNNQIHTRKTTPIEYTHSNFLNTRTPKVIKESKLVDTDHLCPTLEVGCKIRFGQYRQNNAVDDITWVILEKKDDLFLVTSEKILDCQPYAIEKQKANWQQSYIRRWLNNTFLQMAFSKEEQKRIHPVMIEEPIEKSGCIDCYDKITLFTPEEAEKYFEFDDDRLFEPTEYARAFGAIPGDWWLKSGSYCEGSHDEFSSGEISWCSTFNCSRGVKPCMWIKMQDTNLQE